MEIYKIGPDELSFDEYAERFEWVVYHYEEGRYDGSGEAVALGKDGLIYTACLSHCSCYGPLDEHGGTGFGDKGESLEAFKERDSIAHQSSIYPNVSNRALELLGA